MTKLIKDMYYLLKEEDPNLATKDLVAKSAFAEMDADQDRNPHLKSRHIFYIKTVFS